uniref:hAT-like transposase RNase-H fold domain-containing protein n=1 Tax=Chenopodium quinoa TaxID=63459 RepID=A0A803MQS7_CHEQI
MLDTALKFQRVFSGLSLPDGEDLNDNERPPEEEDWKKVQRLTLFLKGFYVLTKRISGSHYVTSNKGLSEIASMYNMLNKWEKSGDLNFQAMDIAMKQKFDKYWGNVNKMNKLIYVASILDPHCKFILIELSLIDMHGKEKGSKLANEMVQALICSQDWLRAKGLSIIDVEETLKELEEIEKGTVEMKYVHPTMFKDDKLSVGGNVKAKGEVLKEFFKGLSKNMTGALWCCQSFLVVSGLLLVDSIPMDMLVAMEGAFYLAWALCVKGGPVDTLKASIKKASEQAVRGLRAKFGVQVDDFSSDRIGRLERCGFLYEMKRLGLESIEKPNGKTPVRWPSVPNQKRAAKYVCIDYLYVLRTLAADTGASVSSVEALAIADKKCIAWLTICNPYSSGGLECIYSSLTGKCKTAVQDAAKKRVDFLCSSYNLNIVDLNHTDVIYAGIKCALAKESFMAVKERVLGVQQPLHLPPFFTAAECSTPKSTAHQLKSSSCPLAAPRKPKARPNKASRATLTPVAVPKDLELVFKRRKLG